MKKSIIILAVIIAGCATRTPIPQPVPAPCEVRVNGECREMTPAERTGPVVRGHGEEVKDTK